MAECGGDEKSAGGDNVIIYLIGGEDVKRRACEKIYMEALRRVSFDKVTVLFSGPLKMSRKSRSTEEFWKTISMPLVLIT